MTDPYYEADGITLYHGDCMEVTDRTRLPGFRLAPTSRASGPAPRCPCLPRWDAFVSSRTTQRRSHTAGQSRARPRPATPQWKAPRPPFTRQVLIWDKTDGVGPGMGDLGSAFGSSHEEVYLLGQWPKSGPRQGSVLRTAHAMGNPSGLVARLGHPTPKPADLMERIVSAAPPGVIADPFAGSGSTLVAARNLGRKAIGVEIEEKYCEIIARRLDQQVLPL